jgi:hypothetical protein
MSNEKVIKKFLEQEKAQTPLRDIANGYYTYKGRTLWTRGGIYGKHELMNYHTRIAYIQENKLYINTKKYSSTTSKIQGKLKQLASLTNYNIVEYQE